MAGMLAFAATLIIALLMTADGDAAPAATESTGAPIVTGHTDHADGFVSDWAGSANGNYSVTGTVYRIRQSESARLLGSPVTNLADADITLDYHHRQSGRMELTQLGETVTVVDVEGGERACRMIEGRPWCDEPGPGTASESVPFDLQGRRGAEVAAVVDQVQGPHASHRIHPLAVADIESEFKIVLVTSDVSQRPRCWEARALVGDQGHRWGRRAQFCFDASTGGPVFRRIFGLNRIEVFIADEVTT